MILPRECRRECQQPRGRSRHTFQRAPDPPFGRFSTATGRERIRSLPLAVLFVRTGRPLYAARCEELGWVARIPEAHCSSDAGGGSLEVASGNASTPSVATAGTAARRREACS